MEKLTVPNRKKENLSALFHEPARPTRKILIFTHSFKGDKDYQPIMREFSERICTEGYAVLRFDCWGSGESDGRYEDSSITTQIEDLQDIMRYVKTQGYTDICLMGLSMGTSVSIMAYDDSVRCMVLLSAVFQHTHLYEAYRQEIEKNGFIVRERKLTGEKVTCGKAMWQDFWDIRPYERLHEITCPVLVINARDDPHITEEKAREYMQRLPSENRLEILEKGDHDFMDEKARKKAIEFSTDFIRTHL